MKYYNKNATEKGVRMDIGNKNSRFQIKEDIRPRRRYDRQMVREKRHVRVNILILLNVFLYDTVVSDISFVVGPKT